MRGYRNMVIMNMNTKLIRLALLALGVVLSSTAFADKRGPDYDRFESDIQSLHKVCEEYEAETCLAAGYSKKTLFTTSGRESDPGLRSHLSAFVQIANHQSNIWADTILEGDYEAEVPERIDVIEGIYRGEQLIAYRLIYSAKAWLVNPDGSRELEGRIVEASFVSPAFSSWMRDENAYATFFE